MYICIDIYDFECCSMMPGSDQKCGLPLEGKYHMFGEILKPSNAQLLFKTNPAVLV